MYAYKALGTKTRPSYVQRPSTTSPRSDRDEAEMFDLQDESSAAIWDQGSDIAKRVFLSAINSFLIHKGLQSKVIYFALIHTVNLESIK